MCEFMWSMTWNVKRPCLRAQYVVKNVMPISGVAPVSPISFSRFPFPRVGASSSGRSRPRFRSLTSDLWSLLVVLPKGSGLYGAQAESNMLNYDLTPAKWASGNSTMRFSVENCPKKRFS